MTIVEMRERATRDMRNGAQVVAKWLANNWARGGGFKPSWPIGFTAHWIAALLTLYVLVYYL